VLPWLPAAPSPPGPIRGRRPLGSVAAEVVAAFRRVGPRRLVALLVLGALVLAAVIVTLVQGISRTMTTPFLSYTAPAGWSADPTGGRAPLDVPGLTGAVHGPRYDCGGEPSVRGYVAATFLPVDAAPGSGPADRADRLARWFAGVSYAARDGTAPALTVAPPRPVRVAGPDGPVDASVTEVDAQTVGRGGCGARGTVAVLAAPASGGAALLLVAGDTGGGPASPAPPDRATLDAVLASVRLGGPGAGLLSACRSAPRGARRPMPARPPSAPPSAGP
jgi:hypothetical protein